MSGRGRWKPVILRYAVLIFILTLAAVSDLKTYTVKNSLIAAGLAAGILMNVITRGPEGLWDSAAGIIIPVLILFVLFVLRMLGAADIKLFSVAGAFLGTRGALAVIVFSFLSGGIISLILMIKRDLFVKRLKYLFNYSKTLFRTGRPVPYERLDLHEGDHFMHFAVPVLMGVLCLFTAEMAGFL